ncbi:MAG: 1-deoxy-D-xylulose-5-phosphate reductoisomerase [Rubricoccaceae bacterium]|nr:1-deoxy-D-xylulose-5-phosphate reductoisomerase [Rubricoccaceae bacterium]
MIPLSIGSQETERPTRSSIVVLGSTGSIGTQSLEIVAAFPDRLRVVGLSAGSNWEMLAKQARAFQPEVVCIADKQYYGGLEDALSDLPIRVTAGEEGLCELATLNTADVVLASIVGAAGLRSTLAAVDAGKRVALANKEALVVAGELVEQSARKSGAIVIPVDSEHSAIFQCLVGECLDSIESLILTASGGPFRTRPAETFSSITQAEALAHPNWTMGAKITIDSATLMNKGLEVIEARWLFGVQPDQIEVMVHPQSIIHSLVTFKDGSAKAQLGVPDMKVPIQYALTYPDRWEAQHDRVDWKALRSLDFEEPDTQRFPCLGLAYSALEAGGVAPTVLNAANEAAVAHFLKEEIGFMDIPRLIAQSLESVASNDSLSLPSLIQADEEARAFVSEHVRLGRTISVVNT